MSDWNIDTNGCLHFRCKLPHTFIENKKLLGIKRKTFKKIFGRPNESRYTGTKHNDESMYIYYACSDCDGKGNNVTNIRLELNVIFVNNKVDQFAILVRD